MKRILLGAIMAILAMGTQAQDAKLINDKNAQVRQASGFHAIRVSNGIDLYLSQGTEAVAVSASEAQYRDRIMTVVENGVLKIYLDDKWSHWNWGNQKLKAYVSFSMLDGLHASGGSDIYTTGVIKSDKLDLTLSGGSDFKDAKVDINDMHIRQSGGSDVHISGRAGRLTVDASGGSDLHGYDLVTDFCNIEASGGSDATITVNKELNVDASGGSDIYYKGAAVIKELKTSGSGSVSRKG